MNYKFKYGFGGIEEILQENIDKEENIDSLDIPIERKKSIILPQIIGVYQEQVIPSLDNINNRDLQESFSDFLHTIIPTPEPEKASPYLICIGYDPTILKKEIIEYFLDGFSRQRIKISEYQTLPDFNEKRSTEVFDITYSAYDALKHKNISVIERGNEVLNRLREEYGLTKSEYVVCKALGYILRDENREKIEELIEIIEDY